MANRSLNCGYIGQNNLIDGVAPFTSIQLNSRFNQISCPSLASPTKTRTVRAALCDSEWAIRTKSYRTVHFPSDSVRLALENFERGGDSARKCSVRFGTVRGCTVRGAHSAFGGHFMYIHINKTVPLPILYDVLKRRFLFFSI